MKLRPNCINEVLADDGLEKAFAKGHGCETALEDMMTFREGDERLSAEEIRDAEGGKSRHEYYVACTACGGTPGSMKILRLQIFKVWICESKGRGFESTPGPLSRNAGNERQEAGRLPAFNDLYLTPGSNIFPSPCSSGS